MESVGYIKDKYITRCVNSLRMKKTTKIIEKITI